MSLDSSIINSKFNQKLITKLTNSFVNDYLFWKNIIESTNRAISIRTTNVLETRVSIHLYTYDEFCKKFIEHVENINNEDTFNQESIQHILLQMIHNKN